MGTWDTERKMEPWDSLRIDEEAEGMGWSEGV